MKSKDKIKTIGINLGDLWLAIFIVLKLTHVIDWSWWWVLSPLWASILLVIFLYGIIYLLEKGDKK